MKLILVLFCVSIAVISAENTINKTSSDSKVEDASKSRAYHDNNNYYNRPHYNNNRPQYGYHSSSHEKNYKTCNRHLMNLTSFAQDLLYKNQELVLSTTGLQSTITSIRTSLTDKTTALDMCNVALQNALGCINAALSGEFVPITNANLKTWWGPAVILVQAPNGIDTLAQMTSYCANRGMTIGKIPSPGTTNLNNILTAIEAFMGVIRPPPITNLIGPLSSDGTCVSKTSVVGSAVVTPCAGVKNFVCTLSPTCITLFRL